MECISKFNSLDVLDLTQFYLTYISIMNSTFQNCYILTSVKYGKLSYRSNIKQRMYIKF